MTTSADPAPPNSTAGTAIFKRHQHPMRQKTESLKPFAIIVTALVAVSSIGALFCEEGKAAKRPSLPHGLITISSLVMLPTEYAAKELGLSDSQFSEIKVIRKDFESLLHEIAERFSNEDPEMQAESDIHSRIVHAAHTLIQPKLDEVFTPDQALRLEQIHWQGLGVDFLRISGVPEYLKLSDGQTARIDRFVYKLEHRDFDSLAFRIKKYLLGRYLGRDVYDDKGFNARERKTLANVMGVLTSEQKKLVDNLYGKKIDRDELARQTENLGFFVEYEKWDAESQMKSKIGLSMR